MLRLIGLFITLSALSLPGLSQGLIINEFMASNSYVLSDNSGDFDDWIEIYNPTGTDIDLAGYYFSDNPNNKLKYQIPSTNPIFTTITAGGYLIFWADGDTTQGPTHLDFRLFSEGESIILTNPQETIEDLIQFTEQKKNVSYSRIPNGTGSFFYCTEATPYAENTSIGYNGFVKSKPIFSIESTPYTYFL